MLINKTTVIHIPKYTKVTKQQVDKINKIDDLNLLIQKNMIDMRKVDAMVWDSLDNLNNYLKSPDCYKNQIVGCNGRAYIVINENGENTLKEIGSLDDISKLVSKIFYIGNVQPENTNTIWFDNSDLNVSETDFNSEFINELTAIISNLTSRISELEKEVKYLKYSIENNTSNYEFILSEEGDTLLSEDGNNILAEKLTITDNIITENNDTLLSENDEEILLETA